MTRRALRALGAAGVATAAVLGLVALHRQGLLAPGDVHATIARVHALRHARLGFVALYAVGAAVGVPVTPLTLVGGAVFGTGEGILLNWIGEMFGAAGGYTLGRLARPTAQRVWRRLSGRATDPPALDGGLALLRLRVIPVVPFAVLNVGAALAGMRWPTFLVSTAVGIIPVTSVYTAFASSLVAGAEGAGTRAFATALVAGGGIVALTLLPALARRVRDR